AAAQRNIGSEGTSGRLWQPTVVRRFNGSALQLRPPERASARPVEGGGCDKWAVITTIFAPTKLVRQLVALEDWCVVVVGDRKAQSEEQYVRALQLSESGRRRFTYLDEGAQRRLRFNIIEKLPWDHFGRKNVGFMYALERGANVVYDTDDDNELLDASSLSAWA
ncbi:hypothetical protein T492DRAFT_582536, partial [Pavlovales sp. CCMP2436]